jgi:hypothetical protein
MLSIGGNFGHGMICAAAVAIITPKAKPIRMRIMSYFDRYDIYVGKRRGAARDRGNRKVDPVSRAGN